MTDILMPKLSDSMEEGIVLQWLIEGGQPVSVGDELLEIETDKATMIHASEVEGILEIVVEAGATVRVGDLIARVGPPNAAGVAASRGSHGITGTPPERAAVHGNGGDASEAGEPRATPLARRIARTHGIALEDVPPTGLRGRITKTDVLRAAGQESPSKAPPRADLRPKTPGPHAPSLPKADGAARRRELSRLQQVIARRMAEAKATIPHFQVQVEVVMDEAIALRGQIKAVVDEGQPAPSFNDIIIKACALALRSHSQVNGSYKNGRFELHERVNVGVAVAAEEALVVPTVFDADTKSLGQIARESQHLAERVRSGEITPPELSGATFTVSNLGMYGMTAIIPVINPPQAAILGVGAMREVLAREDGEVVDRSLITLTLSCDHRILYGADASRFLADVKTLLEQPLILAL